MYIYGKNVAIEALKNNKEILKSYIYKNFSDKKIISELQKKKIEINYCEKFELDKLVNGNHQGIILSVLDYKYSDLESIINRENSMIVMLDHIEDPHNFGAIIRTCEAASVDGIIIPKDRSVSINSTVVKVSTGALENMRISMVTNLSQTLKRLKDNGFWIIGTDMVGQDYSQIDYHGKICIVIGNEGKGLSKIVRDECDFMACIPMIGKINSLNASVATGIILFEAIKQRKG